MERSTGIGPPRAGTVLALVLLFGILAPTGATSTWARRAPTPNTPQSAAQAGSLADMLGSLPDLPLGGDGAMVTYADAARQASALGVAPPRGIDDTAGREAWVSAIRQLMLPPSTAQQWADREWREVFGFDLYQVDQAAEYEAPPFSLTVLRGRFDVDEMRAAWSRGGYQSIDLGAGEAYAVREDFEIDFADPGSRLALAHLNVVALTDNGTLIFGSSRDAVRGALAASTGQVPSFAERPEVTPLVQSAPADLGTALLVPGVMLQAVADPAEAIIAEESPEDFATRVTAEQVEAQRLPPIAAALLGLTAGAFADGAGPATPAAVANPARIVAVLAILGPRAADDAAAVIEDRLATHRFPELLGGDLAGRPWVEIFPERSVRAFTNASTVLIELAPAPGVPPHLLDRMINTRTPGFLAWSP